MAELKLISPGGAPPAPGRFIETRTAEAILHSLRVVHQGGGQCVGLIAGAPGVGKTEAIRRFKAATPGVFIQRAVEGEGGAHHLAQELWLMLDPPDGDMPKGLAALRRRIVELF